MGYNVPIGWHHDSSLISTVGLSLFTCESLSRQSQSNIAQEEIPVLEEAEMKSVPHQFEFAIRRNKTDTPFRFKLAEFDTLQIEKKTWYKSLNSFSTCEVQQKKFEQWQDE